MALRADGSETESWRFLRACGDGLSCAWGELV